MPVRIKICGITRYEDAKVAVSLGVDALGFIFYPKSPRCVTPEQALAIIRQLPTFVNRVGVFVDEDPSTIANVARFAQLDTIQLHGKETPEQCRAVPFPVIKAFAVSPESDITVMEQYDVAAYLLDTWHADLHGGSGMTFDWSIARRACTGYSNVILAGGLGPTNIEEALDVVGPFGVDLNSGVEIRPGIKNPHKMRDAVTIIKNWRGA